ncbi:MAG: hypothetical protein ACKVS8_06640 [Phycisphaerales bacterium]
MNANWLRSGEADRAERVKGCASDCGAAPADRSTAAAGPGGPAAAVHAMGANWRRVPGAALSARGGGGWRVVCAAISACVLGLVVAAQADRPVYAPYSTWHPQPSKVVDVAVAPTSPPVDPCADVPPGLATRWRTTNDSNAETREIAARWQCNASLRRYKAVGDGHFGTGNGDILFGGDSIRGFAGNFNRTFAPPAGTYPPRVRYGPRSSLPLLSAGAGRNLAPKALPERPLHDGIIDLITGAPLIQEVDMELPFGGAVFRHVRTYTDVVPGTPELPTLLSDRHRSPPVDADRFWDWQGPGWMMSESPLLLIDAATADTVAEGPRRTWLMIDAHHSIPFDFDKARGEYICPPRFDARLVHDGTWTPKTDAVAFPEGGAWMNNMGIPSRPQVMRIWLQSDTLCLTFKPDWEDMPETGYVRPDGGPVISLHERAATSVEWEPTPGGAIGNLRRREHSMGVPYMGYLTGIHDAHGHRVEISVAGISPVGGADSSRTPRQRAMGVAPVEDAEEMPASGVLDQGCACVQGCAERGQVRTVRLLRRADAAGGEVCEWTLVYVYRNFWGLTDEGYTPNQGQPVVFPADERTLGLRAGTSNSLHAIYAYRGDVQVNVPPGGFVLEGKHFLFKPIGATNSCPGNHDGPCSGHAGLDDPLFSEPGHQDLANLALVASYDELDQLDAAQMLGLPDTWEKQVRYTYAEKRPPASADNIDWIAGGGLTTPWGSHPPIWHRSAGVYSAGPVLSEATFDLSGPRLLKATTTTRQLPEQGETESLAETHAETLYRYTRTGGPDTFPYNEAEQAHLTGILPPAAVRLLLRNTAVWGECTFMPGPGFANEGVARTANDIFMLSDTQVQRILKEGDSPSGSWFAFDDNTSRPQQCAEIISLLGIGASAAPGGTLTPAMSAVGMVRYARDGREFNTYHFLLAPVALDGDYGFGHGVPAKRMEGLPLAPGVSLFHEPHNWRGLEWHGSGGVGWAHGLDADSDVPERLMRPTWATVVVEHAPAPGDSPNDPFLGRRTARVVLTSRSGYILKDQTWEHAPGADVAAQAGSVGEWKRTSQQGHSEEYQYEVIGTATRPLQRLVSIRSAGWSANQALPVTDEGLVTWFSYASQMPDDPDSLVLTKVEITGTRGTAQSPPDRQVIKEIEYRPFQELGQSNDSCAVPGNKYVAVERDRLAFGAGTDGNGAGARWRTTVHNYQFVRDPEYIGNDGFPIRFPPRMVMKETLRAEVPGPDGTERAAVVREAFDTYGRRTHLLTGSIAGAMAAPFHVALGSAGDDVSLNWVQYTDQGGYESASIVDAEMGAGYTLLQGPASNSNQLTPTIDQPNIAPVGGPETGATCFATPDPPHGRERLEHITTQYNGTFGREWIIYPNKRMDTTQYDEEFELPNGDEVQSSTDGAISVLCITGFKNLAAVASQASEEETGAGETRRVKQGQLAEVRAFEWENNAEGDPAAGEATRTTKIEYDGAGRATGAKVFEGGGTTGDPLVRAEGTRDSYGGFSREIGPDGTITRTLRDAMGRVWRVYRGTNDTHTFWQTAQNPNQNGDDNMVLVEERFYANEGHSDRARNVGKLIKINHFTDKHAGDHESGGPAAVLEPAGNVAWSETFEYDRQMRQVIVSKRLGAAGPMPGGGTGSPGEIFESTVTWLDQMGHTRFVARFGAGAIGHLGAKSPAELGIGEALPTAADLLAATGGGGASVPGGGASLLSLSETTYNDRGLPEEQRTYLLGEPAAAADPPYTATITYYDHADRPVWVETPGGGVRQTVFDALGREIRSAVGVECDAAGLPARGTGLLRELSRTETVYDADGNPLRTTTRERRHDAAATPLGLGPQTANSIASYSFNWYNEKKELIASADVGANPGVAASNTLTPGIELGDGDFINPAVPPSWPQGQAVGGAYAFAGCWNEAAAGSNGSPFDASTRVSLYEYDKQGRQTSVRGPDGSLTKHSYDALNNIVLTTENADINANAWEQRRTAYEYTNGQLRRMAAVLPGHTLTAKGTANWPADLDGTTPGLQITRINYGAAIVGSNFTPISRSNSLVGSVSFPGRTGTGGPAAQPDLWYNYTLDDQIATRRDGRALAFRYGYDAARRLSSIEVGGANVTEGVSGGVSGAGEITDFGPGYLPSDFSAALGTNPRVGYVEYGYNNRGLLADARAYDRKGYGHTAISHSRAAYDARGNLTEEIQIIGQDLTGDLDITLDGVVNPDDLGDFITCQATPECAYDYNGDGGVNPDDLGDFITNYYQFVPPEVTFIGYAWSAPVGLTPRPTAANSTWPLGENRSDRLVAMFYPRHQNLAVPMGQRVVGLAYGGSIPGTAGSGSAGVPDDDSIFSRITSMEQSPDSLIASSNLARFAYSGGAGGRRRGVWMGVVGSAFALAQSVAGVPALQNPAGALLSRVEPPPGSVAAAALPAQGGYTPGLPGLDRHARLADLHYQTAPYNTTVNGITTQHVGTLYRSRMTTDAAGNRLAANITQAAVTVTLAGGGGGGTGTLQPNSRSQVNAYDSLSRLTGSKLGVLQVDAGGYAAVNPPTVGPEGGLLGLSNGSTLRTDSWTLDTLGNWVGNSGAAGRSVSGVGEWGLMEGDPEATPPTGSTSSSFTQVVNPRNEITGVVRTQTGGGTPPPPALTLPPQHDVAGNLTFDGKFIFSYDAWNRLVQVNRATVEAVVVQQNGGEPEPPVPTPTIVIGDLVKQFVYDGLGRMVETRTPIQSAATGGAQAAAPGADGSATPLLAERFYYDGVRRIQETSEVRGTLNPSDGTRAVVEASRRFEREYIWGPGDGHAGIDELLALFEGAKAAEFDGLSAEAAAAASLAAQSKPWWAIQDASGDVVALCDSGGPVVPTGLSPTGAGGAAIGPATTSTGRVVQQFTYDAYGAVLAAEQVVDDPNVVIPNLRVGHKGLFADRLDVGITNSGTDPPSGGGGGAGTSGPLALTLNESERLTRHAQVIYYVRNRVYHPAVLIFGQRDPNGTGQQVVVAAAFHGTSVARQLGGTTSPNLRGHFADGLNAFAYTGLNPIMHADPMGLEFSISGLMGTIGIQGLLGGAIGGAVGGYTGGVQGAAAGAVGGMLGGAAGGILQLGGYGLLAQGAGAGMAFRLGSDFQSGRQLSGEALADAAFDALIGAAFGGTLQVGGVAISAAERAFFGGATRAGGFLIRDWNGYPGFVPQPNGPFRLLNGAEYEQARRAADGANAAMRKRVGQAAKGMEVHDIHPIKFGGNPTDPNNKMLLPVAQHREVSRWWNKVMRERQ